jgi:hypothetical protein
LLRLFGFYITQARPGHQYKLIPWRRFFVSARDRLYQAGQCLIETGMEKFAKKSLKYWALPCGTKIERLLTKLEK